MGRDSAVRAKPDVGLAQCIRHEHFDELAQQLARRVAEHGLQLRVGHPDNAVVVGD